MNVQMDRAEFNVYLEKCSLSKLAQIIKADWKKVNVYAKPHLDAMHSLADMNSRYGADGAVK